MPHKYLAFQSFNPTILTSFNTFILQFFNPSIFGEPTRCSETAKSRRVQLSGVKPGRGPPRRREADAPGGGRDGRLGTGVGAPCTRNFEASGKRAPPQKEPERGLFALW